MKKIEKFHMESKTKIVLEQKADNGDYIDLSEAIKFDNSYITQQFDYRIQELAEKRAVELAKIKTNQQINDLSKENNDLKIELAKTDTKLEQEKNKLADRLNKDFQHERDRYQAKIDGLSNKNRAFSTKSVGEDLEQYLLQQFNEIQRAGGFQNCTFTKINISKKDPGEVKGTKGDFLFTCYKQTSEPKPLEQCEVAFKIVIEAKHHAFDSAKTQKNESFFPKLEADRIKEKADFALLVTTLEYDQNKDDIYEGVYSPVNYDYLYVVRPWNMLSFFKFVTKQYAKNNAIAVVQQQTKLFENRNVFINELDSFVKTVTLSSCLGQDFAMKVVKSCLKGIKQLREIGIYAVKMSSHLNDAHKKIFITNKFVKKLKDKKDMNLAWLELKPEADAELITDEVNPDEKEMMKFVEGKN